VFGSEMGEEERDCALVPSSHVGSQGSGYICWLGRKRWRGKEGDMAGGG
jgi:hypothetical protein